MRQRLDAVAAPDTVYAPGDKTDYPVMVEVAAAPDGTRALLVAAHNNDYFGDLLEITLTPGHPATARPFVVGPDHELFPAFSPNGRWVSFVVRTPTGGDHLDGALLPRAHFQSANLPRHAARWQAVLVRRRTERRIPESDRRRRVRNTTHARPQPRRAVARGDSRPDAHNGAGRESAPRSQRQASPVTAACSASSWRACRVETSWCQTGSPSCASASRQAPPNE